MADQVSLRVCYITDLRRISIRTSTDSTVAEFKALVALRFDVPVDRQRLFHNNRELRDDQTIQSYDLQDGHAVYLMRRFIPATSSASTSVAAAAAPLGGNSTSDISTVGSVQNQGFGGDGATGSSDGTVPGVLINVQYSSETRFAIRVRLELTVGEFKGLITQLQNIPVNEQRLIYSGQFLQDDNTIGSYGLQEGHVIQLARRILPATTCTSAGVADPSPVGENNPLVILNDQQSSVDTNHQVLEAIQNIMMSTNQRASHGRAQVIYNNPQSSNLADISPGGLDTLQNPIMSMSQWASRGRAQVIYNNPQSSNYLADISPGVLETLQNPIMSMNQWASRGMAQVIYNNPQSSNLADISPGVLEFLQNPIMSTNQWASRGRAQADISPGVLDTLQHPIMSMSQWASRGRAQVIVNNPQSSNLVDISSAWVLEASENPVMTMSPWASPRRSQGVYIDPESSSVGRISPRELETWQNPIMSMSPWASGGSSQQLRASYLPQFGAVAWLSPLGTGQTARGAAVPPEEIRTTYQLSQLHEMGFTNNLDNLRALITTGGNLTAALALLLQNLDD